MNCFIVNAETVLLHPLTSALPKLKLVRLYHPETSRHPDEEFAHVTSDECTRYLRSGMPTSAHSYHDDFTSIYGIIHSMLLVSYLKYKARYPRTGLEIGQKSCEVHSPRHSSRLPISATHPKQI